MPSIFKIPTTNCGEIEITANVAINSSSFISGYLSDMGLTEEYIDITQLAQYGIVGLSATQVRRFFTIWEFLCSDAGVEYRERANIDYWQYRNYRLDDCLDEPLKLAMKATPEEHLLVLADLARATTVPVGELETNEHTKEFLEKGYIGLQLVVELLNYADFLGIDICVKLFAGCFAGNMKRLVKVFPVPPPNTDDSDDKPGLEAIESGSGFVEETVVSMETTTASVDTKIVEDASSVVSEMEQ